MPRPRDITNQIMAQPTDGSGNDIDIPSTAKISEYFQFFGQFLTHDLAEAELVGSVRFDGSDVVADGPPLFLDGLPFPLNRTPDNDADPNNERNQTSDETAFLDLSNVYGSDQKILDLLRERDAGGDHTAYLLRGATDNTLPTLQEVFDHHSPFDPSLTDVNQVIRLINATDQASPLSAGPDGFAAGDNRVNQQPHLTSHHVLWMRNHNWHVDQLKAAYPGWTEDQLFEAARALNEAEWQNIVYNEYMTKLIGKDAIDAYSGYKDDVDPTVINEWTTVAFRFGHDETRNVLDALDERGTVLQTLTLGEAFAGGPDLIRTNADTDKWIRAQLAAVTQEIDGKVVAGNRNALFGIPAGPPGTFATVDLEVFDIVRARDHGVGRYNKLRDGLGFDTYDDFDDFAADSGVDATTLAALKLLYNTGADADLDGVPDDDGIDRLDSIVGGLLEKKATGSLLGETFTLLNVLQFEAFRDGDRLFYLNRFKDHPDLINMIESVSLADLIERNTTIDHVYRDAFLAHNRIGGTDGNNTVNGSDDVDLLIGFKGNDKLYGKKGDDDLYGDEGNDQAWGGAGADMIWGGKGNDKLYGEIGNDYLDGGDNNDELRGANGDDFLFGGNGNDKLYGGRHADYLDGGEGNDSLYGEQGRDTYAFGHKSGKDTVYGFAKEDKLDLSALEFYSLQDVRDASHKSGKHTIIDLDDYGATVKLMDVGWKLGLAQLILNDGDDYYL
jgi:peroxidase